MQLLTIDSAKAKKLFWSILAAVVVFIVLTTRQTDPVLVGAALLLLLIGVAPFYVWLLGRRHGLPIWPAYSLYACVVGAMPALQKAQSLSRYQDDEVLRALLTMAGFFVAGTTVWLWLTSNDPKPPRKVLMLQSATAIKSLQLCILLGVLFSLNMVTGWVPMPGNSMQVFRGVAGGLSFFGIFAMAYFHGSGMLKGGQIAVYLLLTLALILLSLTGLLIANIVQPIALGVIGYTLGAGRAPWVNLGILFIAVAVLHSGKYEMRNIYGVNAEVARGVELTSLPAFYGEWLSYGVDELGGMSGILQGGGAEDSPTTVFERSGNLHMLALVQQKSPGEVPFLNGLTYEPIPQMLIPRFLMPNKAISHAGNILLSTNYGLVDIEGVWSVSIGWPLIAEAYANYGYFGVFLLSIVLASVYSLATRLTSQVPITSFRFVAGLVVLASVTNENTLGVFVGSQFQGIVGVALASFFLMRRQPNPFAEEQEVEVKSGKVGRWEGRQQGARSEEHGAREESARVGRLEGGNRAERDRLESSDSRDAGSPGGEIKVEKSEGGMTKSTKGEEPAGSTKTAMRATAWMPRSLRMRIIAEQREQVVLAAQAVGAAPSTTAASEASQRPRQVAVPYQNYRRYRG